MPISTYAASHYCSFAVSVYARVYEVRQMGDLKWLEPRWNEISRQAGVDKIYLEDNETFIVESFLPESVDLRVSLDQRYARLRDLVTGEEISSKAGGGEPGGGGGGFGTGGGIRTIFPVSIKPHS